MREIKFRAWGKLIGEMIDVITMDFETKNINDDDYYNMTPFFDDEYVLMQYTGLKDKNGVEIYEGDIVQAHGKYGDILNGEIYYRNGCFMLKEHTLNQIDDVEVIGNIYDNPELAE